MNKDAKKDILEVMNTILDGERVLKKLLSKNAPDKVQNLLQDVQEAAIQVGEAIEKNEGEGHPIVKELEEFCDILWQISQSCFNTETPAKERANDIPTTNEIPTDDSIQKTTTSPYTYCNQLQKKAEYIKKQIQQIEAKYEIVFLPYKASMWDSLESIWMAADADPDCNAVVIPIPYYDKNPDGSFKAMHYEADLFPDEVPVVDYQSYDFGVKRPDVIYVHNPYDNYNYVTSIHPFFYSDNLKKFTKNLVYVPYYATAGSMGIGQALCPVYFHADYIVIQSEKYKNFFDERVPREKFLPLGSPKFDSVIRKCQNPPSIPETWKEKMEGKRVFFYNTSLNGMLADTRNFLQKMEYVFQNFAGRDNVCLLWRPHPLLESTFDSLRKEYKPIFLKLKQYFIDNDLGIYDDTPDMENSIALSDVYIGDSGTSVTSLFGVVGKPMFILNNGIHRLPEKGDWKGAIYQAYSPYEQNAYCVTASNQLYRWDDSEEQYCYLMDLCPYSAGNYYMRAITYKDKVYVIPQNAQDILVLEQDKIVKKIALERKTEKAGAFSTYFIKDRYVFLIPNEYPNLVRMNMENGTLTTVSNVAEFHIDMIDNERIICAKWLQGDTLYFLNPKGDQLLAIDIHSMEAKVSDIAINEPIISANFESEDSEEVWLLPLIGAKVIRWNRITGEKQEYSLAVEGLQSVHRTYKEPCDKRYFGSMAFYEDTILFAPTWGNKFVRLDRKTGEVTEWKTDFETEYQGDNPYIPDWGVGWFGRNYQDYSQYIYFHYANRTNYQVDLKEKTFTEIPMKLSEEDVTKRAKGFAPYSEWLQYCCMESAFCTLPKLLEGILIEETFDKEKQLQEFQKINANTAGNCGEMIHRFLMENRV